MPDVIADSSPIQYLHRLGLLDLLVPDAVFREIEAGRALGADVPDVVTLPWVHFESVTRGWLQPIATLLGHGEQEVILLALQKPDPLMTEVHAAKPNGYRSA
jgi:hypothetical protein